MTREAVRRLAAIACLLAVSLVGCTDHHDRTAPASSRSDLAPTPEAARPASACLPSTRVIRTAPGGTRIVETRPVDCRNVPRSGFRVRTAAPGGCGAGSDSVGQAYRCFTGHFVFDPCWADSATREMAAVVCQRAPWRTTLVRIPLRQGGLEPFLDPPEQHIPHGFPWAVRLTTGERCVAQQGAHSSFRVHGRDRVIDYACGLRGRHALL